MIAYDLQCSNGHTFEGWFEDSKAYADQKKKKLIACPVCNDTNVEVIPSMFAIKTSSASRAGQDSAAKDILARLSKQAIEFVEKNFDNVGCDFAKEALKIHYGAAEPRNIRGVSTKEEEKTLREEGVEFFKIPMPAPPDTES